MKQLLVFALTLFLSATCGSPPTPKEDETHAAIATVDGQFVEALSAGDRARLAALLDEDFAWTNTEGEVLSKAQLLAHLPANTSVSTESREFRIFSADTGGVLTQRGQFHSLRVWAKRKQGWRIILCQEVNQLPAPPSAHLGQRECNNPCKTLPYKPKNDTERAIIASWQALESDVTAHDSAAWATHVSDDFIQISSNSDHPLDKAARMKNIDSQKAADAGAAPPPLASARFDDLGNTVIMHALNHPAAGKPILVTRVWIKRDGLWVMAVSFQTTVQDGTNPEK